MFSKLFGRKNSLSRDIPTLAYQNSIAAIHLRSTSEERRTRIGGEHPLGSGLSSFETDQNRIPFLAALDMEELQQTLQIDWLPATGTLLFFYDHEMQEAWGFDPQDNKYFSVKYSEVRLPLVRQTFTARTNHGLKVFPLKACIMKSVPSWEREIVKGLELSDEESNSWSDAMLNDFGDNPRHQVAGYPIAIQNDTMDLECQLVTNGLYCGDSRGYNDPKAAALEEGKRDWRLLFQIDSDEEAGLMWGDVGTVYFWIKEQDARAKFFDKSWMILQCH